MITIGHYETRPVLKNHKPIFDKDGNQVFEKVYVPHPEPKNCFEVPFAPWHGEQVWNGTAWDELDPSTLKAETDLQIKEALSVEADPLFFKWQAGEIKKEVWLAKRQEIKQRYTITDKKDSS